MTWMNVAGSEFMCEPRLNQGTVSRWVVGCVLPPGWSDLNKITRLSIMSWIQTSRRLNVELFLCLLWFRVYFCEWTRTRTRTVEQLGPQKLRSHLKNFCLNQTWKFHTVAISLRLTFQSVFLPTVQPWQPVSQQVLSQWVRCSNMAVVRNPLSPHQINIQKQTGRGLTLEFQSFKVKVTDTPQNKSLD